VDDNSPSNTALVLMISVLLAKTDYINNVYAVKNTSINALLMTIFVQCFNPILNQNQTQIIT